MPPQYASNLDGILQLTLLRVRQLPVIWQSQVVSSDIGALPKKEQLVDKATQLVVYPDDKTPKMTPAGMRVAGKVYYHARYLIYVVFVTPFLGDVKGNLQPETVIGQQLRLAFRDTTPYAALPAVWDVKPKQATFLDRKAMVKGYDYVAHSLEVITTE